MRPKYYKSDEIPNYFAVKFKTILMCLSNTLFKHVYLKESGGLLLMKRGPKEKCLTLELPGHNSLFSPFFVRLRSRFVVEVLVDSHAFV